jgi:molecular chaperone Hsp33
VNEVQSFLLEGCGIRGALVRLRETWRQVVAQHQYSNELQCLLGEGVAATVLLASGLKHKPKVSLQLQGDGPVKLLLVQCSDELKVRGMAHWREHASDEPLLGEGRLVVNLDTGVRHGLFQGIVPLASARLETCLETYFARSEQLATRLMLIGTEHAVAGLMLQVMPSRDPALDDFEQAAALAQRVSPDELLGLPAALLLPKVFDRYAIRVFDPLPVLHDCRCTPDRLAGVVRMLGRTELESLLTDHGCVELTCEFCNRAFKYHEADVEAILRGHSPSTTLH